jgi:hypothetical protein
MARYFSREAVQQSIDAINADPKHLELAKLLTGKLALRCLDTPDGKDLIVTYRFEAGRCQEFVYEEAAAPSALRTRPFKPMKDGIARVTASYATFVKLDRGEMDPADALNSPDYQIEGSMLMIMPLMQAVDSWNRMVRSLPKEY